MSILVIEQVENLEKEVKAFSEALILEPASVGLQGKGMVDRISTRLYSENTEKKAELDKKLKWGFVRRFFHRFFDCFEVSNDDWSTLRISFGLSIFFTMFVWFMSGMSMSWDYFVCQCGILTLVFWFSCSILSAIFSPGSWRKQIEELGNSLQKNIESLSTNPVFLIIETRKQLEAEAKVFTERHKALTALYVERFLAPRQKIGNDLEAAKKDWNDLMLLRDTHRELKESTGPLILSKIKLLTEQHNARLKDEKDLDQKLKLIKERIESVQKKTEALKDRQSQISNDLETVKRFKDYQQNAIEPENGLEKRARERELQSLHVMLNELYSDVVWSGGAIDEVGKMLNT